MSIYGNLSYGDINSEDYGIYIVDVNDSDMPVRDYTSYVVPGKSRELHYDNGRYKNIDRTYKCIVHSSSGVSAEDIATAYIAQLCHLRGYQRIEDTIHGGYYKLGEFKGGTKPALSKSKNGASFDLTFDCDPYKYLISGETQINLKEGSSTWKTTALVNPGTEYSSPLFLLTGNGAIKIHNKTMTISNNSDAIAIDCDTCDAYRVSDHLNKNDCISLDADWSFFKIEPGEVSISVKQSQLSACTIIPRWVTT